LSFSGFELQPEIMRGLKELGYARPTRIQSDSLPPALAGKDVLACASTGSGKTAAFVIPIVQKLIGKPRKRTRALVLAPTRELAAQIVEQFNAIAVHTPITAAAIIGGVAMGPQEHAFRSGVDVIVATPGRLLDHLRSSYVDFASVEHLVLDEADRMLDMGFLPEIRKILKHVPAKRQTLFFSATMPGPIRKLAEEMLHSPFTVNLERTATPAVGITQAVYPVPQELKAPLFLTLLERGEINEALVFTRTKHRANRLAEFLVKKGIAAERIHGNRSQAQRTAALAGFKSGKHRVLVATDIAARGIDVEELGHVVNFDVPVAPEDYIHRVGRTGRAEATGEAYTFFAPDEEGELRAIERAIGRQLPRVTVPGFEYNAKPTTQLEIPARERIAQIRARKAEDRKRAAANAERRAAAQAGRGTGGGNGGRGGSGGSSRGGSGRGGRSGGGRSGGGR
jgi:ATP-dependent RNA helicase RhlE